MRALFALSILALGASCAASPEHQQTPAAAATDTVPVRAAPPPHRGHDRDTLLVTSRGVPEAMRDSLRTWLEAPDTVRFGEPVRFTLMIENRSDRPVQIEYQGLRQPAANFTITSPALRREVWIRVRNVAIPAVGGIRTITARSVVRWDQLVWDQRDDQRLQVPPGTYEATATPIVNWPVLPTPPLRFHIALDLPTK